MTLILSIPVHDGIVMASDSQITHGDVRWQEKKIKQLNGSCLWSASGELALIQRIEEAIQKMPERNQQLSIIRDTLSGIVKSAVTTLLQQDFRTQFFQADPDSLLRLHYGDFMFAEWFDNKARILHLLSNGTTEWINRPFASGVGATFAYALLHKYRDTAYDLQRATLLTYKVLEESIRVGSFGLDFPIDIWKIDPKGVKNLNEAEVAALSDAVKLLREAEISSFLG